MKTMEKQSLAQSTITDNCPKCGFISKFPFYECPRCGLIISKYRAKQAQMEAQESRNRIQQVQSTMDLIGAKNIMMMGITFEYVGTVFFLLARAGVIDIGSIAVLGGIFVLIGGVITIVSTYRMSESFGFGPFRATLVILANCLVFANLLVTLGLVVQCNREIIERVVAHLDAFSDRDQEETTTPG